MTREEYASWATHHATAFGLTSDADISMIYSWYEPFVYAGFIAADLRSATTAMIAKSPPQFRSDHLRLIQANASISSRARANRASEAKDEFGGWTCKQCTGSGWVTVPHPHSLADGRMVRGVYLAVTCKCGKGMATAASEKKPISFERYERWNPNWREQLETWEIGLTKMANAKNVAEQADKNQPHTLINGLADQFRIPKTSTQTAPPPMTTPQDEFAF